MDAHFNCRKEIGLDGALLVARRSFSIELFFKLGPQNPRNPIYNKMNMNLSEFFFHWILAYRITNTGICSEHKKRSTFQKWIYTV